MTDPLKTIVLDGSWRHHPIPEIPSFLAQRVYRSKAGVFVEGPPGPTGRAGNPGLRGESGSIGPTGITTGFGQVTYTHTTAVNGEHLDANQPTQLIFRPDGAQQDYLNPPFYGHKFWDGNKVVGRAFADLIILQVNLQVRSSVAGGALQIVLDAGSSLGPIVADSELLFAPINTTERVTFLMLFQTLANVMSNGGKLYLTSTVPMTVIKESLLFAPQSLWSETIP